jgi:heat shock protein HslJ
MKNIIKKTTIFSMIFVLITATAGCINSNSKIVGKWGLVSYGAEVVTLALPDVDTYIQFDANGKFNGNVGCNSFGGNYNLNGDGISFNSIQSTEMYCNETWSQEETVLQVLSQPNLQIHLNNNSLSIASVNGLYVVNLFRK